MIFVTADSDRMRLNSLTRQLVMTFPGSTIYQHSDPMRAAKDVLDHKVNGVFLEMYMDKVNGIELMQLLRRQRQDVPIYILSESEEHRDAAMAAGAAGFYLWPPSEQDLKNAVAAGSFTV